MKKEQVTLSHVEHIGIAVRDLNASFPVFEALLGAPHYKTECVESEGVKTAFYQCGETKIELLEATSPESPIQKFIDKRGPGLHHIAFSVTDIQAEMNRLSQAGFELINKEPAKGADNKLVCFIHPKSTGGVLIELCQDANHS